MLTTDGVVRDQVKPIQNEKPSGHQTTALAVKLDPKSRFTEPPAPPPRQPLPEKPGTAREDAWEIPLQGSLRRTETEKPSIAASPSQVVSLVEALASAKREIEAQGARVKHLEEMLQEERIARESAEGRAQQLEKRSREDVQIDPASSENREDEKMVTSLIESLNGKEKRAVDNLTQGGLREAGNEKASARMESEGEHDSAARLQRRLDLMMVEMSQMKQMMEAYKLRAETAEKDSASSSKSLAEMVEKIRREEAERETKRQKVNGATDLTSKADSSSYSLGDVASTLTLSSAYRTGEEILENGKFSSGDETTGSEQARPSSLTRMRNPHDHLVHSAPYASILGVVAIGVGLMAYLNGWQKVER